MGVFFRITDIGTIMVAKTAFSNKISEEEFQKKAKFIPTEKFLAKYNGQVRERLEKEINIVSNINAGNLSRFGAVMIYVWPDYYIFTGCYMGDKYFPDFFQNGYVYKRGMVYAYENYGDEFMDRIIGEKYLDGPLSPGIKDGFLGPDFDEHGAIHYFFFQEEIDAEEFWKLSEIYKKLTVIRSADKPLLNSNDNRKETKRR